MFIKIPKFTNLNFDDKNSLLKNNIYFNAYIRDLVELNFNNSSLYNNIYEFNDIASKITSDVNIIQNQIKLNLDIEWRLWILKHCNITNKQLIILLFIYIFTYFSKKLQLHNLRIIKYLNFFILTDTKKLEFMQLHYSKTLDNKIVYSITILYQFLFDMSNNFLFEILTKKKNYFLQTFCLFMLKFKFLLFSYQTFNEFEKISFESFYIVKFFFFIFCKLIRLFNNENCIRADILVYLYLHKYFFVWSSVYLTNLNLNLVNKNQIIGENLDTNKKILEKKNYYTPTVLQKLIKKNWEKKKIISTLIEKKINYNKKKIYWWDIMKNNLLWIPRESKPTYFWFKHKFWINQITYDSVYKAYYKQFYPLFLLLKAKLFINNFGTKQLFVFSYYERFQINTLIQFKKNLFPTAFWIRCSRLDLIKYLIHYLVDSIPVKWYKKNKSFLYQLYLNKLFNLKIRYKKRISLKLLLATYLYNLVFSNKQSFISAVYAFRVFLKFEVEDLHQGDTYNLRIFLYLLITEEFIKKYFSECLEFLRISYLAKGKTIRLFRTVDKYFESYKFGVSEIYSGYILRLARFLLLNVLYEDILRYIARDNKAIFSKYTHFGKLGICEYYEREFINHYLQIYDISIDKYPYTVKLELVCKQLKFKLK